jgi:hypothetical protein
MTFRSICSVHNSDHDALEMRAELISCEQEMSGEIFAPREFAAD